MPPEVSRRSACNRCHALKSRCTTAPGSFSCDRCCRLRIPCEYDRGRRTSPASERGAYPSWGRDAAALRYCWTPAAFFADREGPPSFGPSPPSRTHWLSPPHTTLGLEYDPPVHQTDWDFLNDGTSVPDGWAQQGAPDASVYPIHLLTPSIDADMGLVVDRPIATVTPPESGAALQPSASSSETLVEVLAPQVKDGDQRGAPAAPAAAGSPTTPVGQKEGMPHQTTHAPHDGPPPPASPQASPDQLNPPASLHQQLLDLQARLCTVATTTDSDGGQVEKLFEESEMLLDILGRLVADPPGDACHQKGGGGPQPQWPPSGEQQQPPGSSSSSASLPMRASGHMTRADTDGQGPMSSGVMSLMALTCYLCLLQRYDGFLKRLSMQLQHSRDRRKSTSSHHQDQHQVSHKGPGTGTVADVEGGGQAEVEGPRGQQDQDNHGQDDRAKCQGVASGARGAVLYDHLGKFQLFESMELNAAYLVPLTARMIERLHSSIERGLVSRAPVEYREEQRWANWHDVGAGAGGRQPSMPQIAWLAVHNVTDMYARVLDTIFVVEKGAFVGAG